MILLRLSCLLKLKYLFIIWALCVSPVYAQLVPQIHDIYSLSSSAVVIEIAPPELNEDQIIYYDIIETKGDDNPDNDTVAFRSLPTWERTVNGETEYLNPMYKDRVLAVATYSDRTRPNDTKLEPNTWYYFIVRAHYEDGAFIDSPEQRIKTLIKDTSVTLVGSLNRIEPPPEPLEAHKDRVRLTDKYKAWAHDKYIEHAIPSPAGRAIELVLGQMSESGLREKVSELYSNGTIEGCLSEIVSEFAGVISTREDSDIVANIIVNCIRNAEINKFEPLLGNNELSEIDKIALHCIKHAYGQLVGEAFVASVPFVARDSIGDAMKSITVACIKEGMTDYMSPEYVITYDDYMQGLLVASFWDGLYAFAEDPQIFSFLQGASAKALAYALTVKPPLELVMSEVDRYWLYVTGKTAYYSGFFPPTDIQRDLLLGPLNKFAQADMCDMCIEPSITLQQAETLMHYMLDHPFGPWGGASAAAPDPSWFNFASSNTGLPLAHAHGHENYLNWWNSLGENDQYRINFTLYSQSFFYAYFTMGAEYFSAVISRLTNGSVDPKCTFTWRYPQGVYCGLDEILKPPQNVSMVTVGDDEVEVQWDGPSLVESRFRVAIYENSSFVLAKSVTIDPFPITGPPDQVPGWPYPVVDPRTTTIRIDQLSAGRTYCVQVQAVSQMHGAASDLVPLTISEDSNFSICTQTSGEDEELRAPMNPGLSLGADPEHELLLEWTDPGGTREGYTVELYREYSATDRRFIYRDYLHGGNITSKLFNFLEPGVRYCTRVQSFHVADTSAWVPEGDFLCETTHAASQPPGTASNIRLLTLADGESVIAYWDDNSVEEHGFVVRLWHMTEEGATRIREAFVVTNTTQYIFNQLDVASNYCVQVASYRTDSGTSDFNPPDPLVYHNQAPHCASTPGTNTEPDGVANVALSLAQVDAVRVNWDAFNTTATAYRINLFHNGQIVDATVNAGWDREAIFYNLEVGVEYCAQVRASNKWGYSEWVPATPYEACIVTGSVVTGVVENVEIVANAEEPFSAIDVNWELPAGTVAHGFRIELYHNNQLIRTRSPLEINALRRSVTFRWLRNSGTYCTRVANFTIEGGLSDYVPDDPTATCVELEDTGEVEMNYYATYYNGTELDGDPIHFQVERELKHVWGTDISPAPGVDTNFWSARWVGIFNISKTDLYTFVLRSDDGSRLFLDGELLIDKWEQGDVEEYTKVQLEAGTHHVVIEYFQGPTYAEAQFWLGRPVDRKCNQPVGVLCVNYYANTQGIGAPVYWTTETTIDHVWPHLQSPAPQVRHDDFMGRWIGNIPINAETAYLFQLNVDNGAKVWLDNNVLIDAWSEAGEFDHFITQLESRAYPLKVEYFDARGDAFIDLEWGPNYPPQLPNEYLPQDGEVLIREDVSDVVFHWITPGQPDFGFINDPDGERVLHDLYLGVAGTEPLPLVVEEFIFNRVTRRDLPTNTEYEWYVVLKDPWNQTITTPKHRFYLISSPGLIANFELATLNGTHAEFVDRSIAENTSITSWSWDLNGDGIEDATSAAPSFDYVQPGSYTVSLTISDGTLSDTETKVAYVYIPELPVILDANFEATTVSGAVPLDVRFNDTSIVENTTIISWQWDVDGDGNIDTEYNNFQNPQHTYTSSGVYTVSLIVSDGINSDQEIKVDYITVEEGNSAPTIDNPTPKHESINQSIGSLELSWEASDVDGDPLLFDVYFGTNSEPTLLASDIEDKQFVVNNLEANTVYYWYVVAKDDHDHETRGPLWVFTTMPEALLNAPMFEWVRHVSGPDNDSAHDSDTDLLGNTYVTGTFQTSLTLDSTILLSSGGGLDNDIYIAKYDVSGNLIWAKQAGGVGFDRGTTIRVLENGNLLVAGLFTGTAQFDNETLTAFAGDQDMDVFIAHYSSDGELLWVTQIYGDGVYTGQVLLNVDNLGNIYVGASFTDMLLVGETELISNGSSDIYLAKYDSDAHLIWVKQFGSERLDDLSAMKIDSNANVIIAGRFTDSISFDDVILETSQTVSDTETYMTKIDTAGDVVWAKVAAAGEGDNDIAIDMAVDTEQNIVLTGIFFNAVLFDDHLLIPQGLLDVFVVKHNPQGEVVWANAMHSQDFVFVSSIATDSDNNIYASGAFRGIANFNNILLESDSAGGVDGYIMSLLSNGELHWLKQISGDNQESPISIKADNFGHVFLSGNFEHNAVFDEFEFDAQGSDVFVAKLGDPNTNSAPYSPISPIPAHESSGQLIENLVLSWQGVDPDGDVLEYDLYFGENEIPALYASHLTQSSLLLENLSANTRYHWRVVARDSHGAETSSSLWQFTTQAPQIDLIIDNLDSSTVRTGIWRSDMDVLNFYSVNVAQARAGGGSGRLDTYRFIPDIPEAGQYNVYIWNACIANGLSNVPHEIMHAQGSTVIAVDQNCDTGIIGQWHFLGEFEFDVGQNGYMEISDNGLNPSSPSFIAADAVRFSNISMQTDPTMLLNADFSADQTQGVSPLTVSFNDLSTSEEISITAYEWDLDGDGVIDSMEINPVYIYSDVGVYTVHLTVYAGDIIDTETKPHYITVAADTMYADFAANIISGRAPLTVNFQNISVPAGSPIVSWRWDFTNDGNYDSSLEHPSYTYSEPGVYSVRLTVSDGSQFDSEIKTEYITVFP